MATKNPLRRKASDVQRGPTLTPEELAARWNVAIGTLKNWRAQSKGPAYIPLTDGDRPPVRYLVSDVEAFERARRKSA